MKTFNDLNDIAYSKCIMMVQIIGVSLVMIVLLTVIFDLWVFNYEILRYFVIGLSILFLFLFIIGIIKEYSHYSKLKSQQSNGGVKIK